MLSFLLTCLCSVPLHAGTWTRLADFPTARSGSAACILDGRIYLIGGTTATADMAAMELFDPATNLWSPRKPLPTARGFCAAAVVDGLIYTFGGGLRMATTTVEVYDPAADSWTSRKPMPTAWKGGQAVVVNGIVYVIGGSVGTGDYGDSLCYAYDPVADSWTRKTPRPAAYICGVALYRGMIYTFGARASLDGPAFPVVYAYDPGTDTWTRKADMPTARTGVSAYLVKGRIYVLGGFQTKNTAVKTAEVYDPLADSWTKLPDMPEAMCFHAGAEVDGKIYTLGGTADWWMGTSNWRYDPDPVTTTDRWTTKANVPTPRGGPSASVVDGRIYLIGGSTATVNLKANEVFDPSTNTWQARKAMPTARGYHSAAVVNGLIYTFGGGLNAPSRTVEVYDPATDQWTSKKDLPVPWNSVQAAVVNGMVYNIGGADSLCYAYDPSADTWTPRTPRPAAGLCGVTVYRGLIYTFGGGAGPSPDYLGAASPAVYVYDPGADIWTRKKDMPTARRGVQSYLLNGKIYVIGGFQAKNSALATVEVYDPLTDSWQTKAPMPQSLCWHAGAEVDGRMYILGGTTDWWLGGEFNLEYDPSFDPTTGVEINETPTTVRAFALYQNYPNPFNPVTTIRYSLPLRAHVTLAVYNTIGQKVTELVNGEVEAGMHAAQFDAARLSSGVYFYRLHAGDYQQTKSLCLIR